MPAHYGLHVLNCRIHALFVMDTCLLWGTCLVCHWLLHFVGYMPCLSLAVALCGVHTLFVTDCCTLWGTYLVCYWLLHIAGYVCHGWLHIAGYRHIQLLSNTGNPMPNCTLFVHVAITNKRGGGVSSCFFSFDWPETVHKSVTWGARDWWDLTDLRLYTSLCLEQLGTGEIWLTLLSKTWCGAGKIWQAFIGWKLLLNFYTFVLVFEWPWYSTVMMWHTGVSNTDCSVILQHTRVVPNTDCNVATYCCCAKHWL